MQYSELYPVYKLADSLGVSMTAVIRGKQYYLFHIERTTGAPGAGAQVMRAMIATAKRHKATVILDCAALEPYYERLGFHVIAREGHVVRMSTKKPREIRSRGSSCVSTTFKR